MKKLFVPIAGLDGIEPAVVAACHVARRFGGVIEGACVLPDLAEQVGLVDGSSWPLGERVSWADRLHAEEAAQHDAFASAAARWGCSEIGQPGLGLHYRWHDGALTGDHAMSEYARLFSLSVVERTAVGRPSLSFSRFEALLFESGRPVLISPPTLPAAIGENILIAWNRSTETTRAVTFAMPLLLQAHQVLVVEVEGQNVPGPTAAELAATLACEGVRAQGRTIAAGDLSSGEAFLSCAKAGDFDLIVKGAYTQSRLRQMFFGGATPYLLNQASLPVFMAH